MKKLGILHTKDLSIGYSKKGSGDYVVLKDLNLSINKGEVVCILGSNGCGKSTLIRTLAGLQQALSGETYIQDVKVDYRNPKSIAKILSVVLTDKVDVGNLTVYDLAAMGRYPYTKWFGSSLDVDESRILDALEKVHLKDFANKLITELSDGELQRAMIAKALVQDTPVILLDEPTAHLDLPNRMETMQLLRKLAKETGKAILLSSHDLELALQTADLLWLVTKKGSIKVGLPEDLVLNGSFEATFETENVKFDQGAGTYRIQFETENTFQLIGNSITGFWTKRAFERHGYKLVTEEVEETKILVQDSHPKWAVRFQGSSDIRFYTLRDTLDYLERNI